MATVRMVARGSLIALAALGAAACGGITEPPSRGLRIEAITATALQGTVAAEVRPAPAVRVTRDDGRPVGGVAVAFQPAEGSGAVENSTVTTADDGSAVVGKWILGPAAGIQHLRAGSDGLADVVFTAVAMPGPATQVARVSGNDQVGGVGQSLPQPLVARVTDTFGNPVAGIPVTFTVTAGGGDLEGGAVLSDASGLATSGRWTLGGEVGLQQVRAVSGAAQVAFRALAVAPPGEPQGRIAFVSLADPDLDIATIDADGSGFQRLPHPGLDLQPAWSPDGSRIAFASDRGENGVIISVMSADGANASALTDGPIDLDPAWSPDGATIAFSSLRDGSAQIAALRVADGGVTVLVDEPGFDGQPAWSSDGRELAFVSDRDAYDFVFDIYTMNADGTGQTQRTRGFSFGPQGITYYLHPAWSPDGSMVAVVYGEFINGRDMRFRVGVMTADGGFLRELAWAGDLAWNEVLDPGSLAWSPNGDYIAYSFVDCDLVTGPGCSRVRSVKYVSLDGSREGTIVSSAHSPSWRR